ncbi:hypothetical protein ACIGXM_16925 [Kitasatospora sp. NPDC052896]|uniref:hypothetical protein n=1 Tax=Kitasatospora sp. NPDC052896 TaxID=3364061 RepID=UPI0037C61AFE
MATSRRVPAYFGSRAHLLGCGGAGIGLLLTLLGPSADWAVVGTGAVAGLYGAGAVLGLAFPARAEPAPAEPPATTEPTERTEPVGSPPEPAAAPRPAVRSRPVSPPPPASPPPASPPPADAELAGRLGRELAAQDQRVTRSGWPEPPAQAARQLLTAVRERLAPETAGQLAPVVREALPAVLDWYERGRSWWRLEPGGPPPEEEFTDRVRVVLEKLP